MNEIRFLIPEERLTDICKVAAVSSFHPNASSLPARPKAACHRPVRGPYWLGAGASLPCWARETLAAGGWPHPGDPPVCCLGRITSTVACDMDLAKYPMDEQECMLHLESCECGLARGQGGVGGAETEEKGPEGPSSLALLLQVSTLPRTAGPGAQTRHVPVSLGQHGGP